LHDSLQSIPKIDSKDVDQLLQVLPTENWCAENDEEDVDRLVKPDARHVELVGRPRGDELQQSFGIYLTAQRSHMP
jgi:hypothetical protein